MPTALFLSPHLDDVAFSCGGTLIRLAQHGWHTILATIFTASVPHPKGFALACQTDKGIPPWVDYMELRREEDRSFAQLTGIGELLWLDLPEAPHRGYRTSRELFSFVRDDESVHERVMALVNDLMESRQPDVVFMPQGLGNHVDHVQLLRAADRIPELFHSQPIYWYQDTPYAIRNPNRGVAVPFPVHDHHSINITTELDRKLDAVACYRTQLGFQFGGEVSMREELARYAIDGTQPVGTATEEFLVTHSSQAKEWLIP